MMPLRHLLSLGLAWLALLPSVYSQVQGSLVAAESSIQPGRPFTVALRLQHEPHWHTYWINAGTGYPTSLNWQLPEGFQAGEIQWPTPQTIKDAKGTITGNGYEGEVLLAVQITPPAGLAPGSEVTLRAKADWLMCAEVCIPGKAELELTLPVRATAPTAAATWGERIAATQAALPREVPGWTARAERAGETLTLRLTGPTAATGEAASVETVAGLKPWFFSESELIAFDRPQTVQPGPAGELVLTLPVAADVEADRLTGVLAVSGSWLTGSERPGWRIDVPIETAGTPLAAGSTGPAGAGSWLVTLVFAWLGGLILNLMPCVFPVLGIKVLGFVNQAGSERAKVTLHGLIFTLGVLLSFWVLAGALTALRAGGDQLGWGFQLQSPLFIFLLSGVMLVFALNLSGVFEFGLGATGIGGGLQMKSGYAGSFFTGVLATVVATPCSAPFLAPALGAALALSTLESFVIFTAIAIGLSTPYLLLSIFPGAIRLLPRPGAWMETFKQAMAFPLYGTVGYLIWVLAGQVDENALLMALFGLTLIAMGVWVYGRWHAAGASPARARFGWAGLVVLLGVGIWLGWPRPPAPTDVVWETWSPERLAQLREEGRPIYVDFTARWCATCQANKKLVFGSADVRDTFREKRIATLKADWTSHDPRITAELAKWGRSAVPFNLVYLPGEAEPRVLPELLTPGIVLEAFGDRVSRTVRTTSRAGSPRLPADPDA